jgi:biopolymer transport protein ExbD
MMTKSLEIASVSRKARVEIIPLIDVVFFLLATFVLFTLSLEKIWDLKAVFPRGVIDPTIKQDDTLYLEAIGPDTLLWREGRNGASERLSLKELNPRLVDFAARMKVPRVALNAGDGAKLGAVTKLLDEVRRAHIEQVCIETAPPK